MLKAAQRRRPETKTTDSLLGVTCPFSPFRRRISADAICFITGNRLRRLPWKSLRSAKPSERAPQCLRSKAFLPRKTLLLLFWLSPEFLFGKHHGLVVARIRTGLQSITAKSPTVVTPG